MSYIKYAELESKIHNLRIGRTVFVKDLDVDLLISEIFELQLDVCKLKIKVSESNIFEKLDAICFPHDILSILVRKTILIEDHKQVSKPRLELKIFNGDNVKNMDDLLNSIISNQTALRFENKLYKSLFQKENSDAFFVEFFKSFDQKKDKDNFCFYAEESGEIIGIGIVSVEGEDCFGLDVGILPEYRGNHYFKEMINAFMFTIQHAEKSSPLYGCKTFSFFSILQNPPSFNTTLKYGFKLTDAVLNINIFSMLDKGKTHAKSINCSEFDLITEMDKQLKTSFFSNVEKPVLTEFRYKNRKSLAGETNWNVMLCNEDVESKWFCFTNPNKDGYGFLKYSKL